LDISLQIHLYLIVLNNKRFCTILKTLGVLAIIIGVILICTGELVVYLSNFREFEHELTNEESELKAGTFFYGLISVFFGALLFAVGNLGRKIRNPSR
jgi:hypothetical protein